MQFQPPLERVLLKTDWEFFGTGNILTFNGGTLASNASRAFDNTRFAGEIVIGGNVQFGDLSSNVVLASSTAALSFANTVGLGGATRTLTIGNAGNLTVNGGTFGISTFNDTIANVGLTSGSITGTTDALSASAYNFESGSVSAILAGTSGINKTTAGTVTISGLNTFTGSSTISGWVLSVPNALALGAAPGSFSPAFLTLNNGTLRLSGSGLLNFSSNRGVTLGTSGGTFDIITGRQMGNQSIVTGGGSLTKIGGGDLILSAANTYLGGTIVSRGILSVSGSLADSGAVTVNGGTYGVATSDTVGAVSLSSGTISGAGTLTGSSYSLTDTGTVSAVLAGSGALTKTGPGTALLSSASTYTGATTVSSGTLSMTGSLASPTFTVDSGATLSSASDLIATMGISKIDGVLGGAGDLDIKTGSVLMGSARSTC